MTGMMKSVVRLLDALAMMRLLRGTSENGSRKANRLSPASAIPAATLMPLALKAGSPDHRQGAADILGASGEPIAKHLAQPSRKPIDLSRQRC